MDSKLQDVIRKVEALLTRANNTDYPEEAKSCQQKAQELMTKYQVDEVSLFGTRRTDVIVSKRIEIPSPYSIDKSILLGSIAKENFCRVLRGKNYAVIYGYESDIELSLTMYRFLLTDMVRQMIFELDKLRMTVDHHTINTTSWKKSFLAGYAQTIGKRLKDAKREQVDSVAKATGDNKFALVLQSKDEAILNYWQTVNKVSSGARILTSASGFNAGKTSGSRADLGQTRISYTRALSK